MMPIAGALLEVLFDKKRTSRTFVKTSGLLCAVIGGLIAAGVGLNDHNLNIGFFCVCLLCVFTLGLRGRQTPRLSKFSSLGQTVITLIGASIFVSIMLSFAAIIFPEQRQYGSFDSETLVVLFVFSVLSVSISQPCWIAGARGLGITIASFHLNAVPFYVMGVLVFIGDGMFDPFKLLGVALIALGVFWLRNNLLRNKNHAVL